jgi:hypothetical protein
LSGAEIGMFTVLLCLAVVLFLKDLYRLFALMCLGRWENRFDRLWARLRGALLFGFGQRRVMQEKFGFNHVLIFWGFLALLLVNAEFLAAGVFPQFSLSFLGPALYPALLLSADVMSAVVLAAVVVAVVRRLMFRPAHIDPTLDAFIILALIGALMLAFFGLNACEFRTAGAEASDKAAWMPVSRLLSGLAGGFALETVHRASRLFWWVHAAALLFFLTYLPRGKHLHILTAIPNCFFRSLSFVTTVPRMVFQKGRPFGVSKVVQFSWKDLLDFYACTECGRCQACCPAHATGKPLDPKQVVHAGKMNLLANGPGFLVGRQDSLASAATSSPPTGR